jgi:ParB-like nuclease domain
MENKMVKEVHLEIKYIHVDEIIKYNNNAKTHPDTQIDRIANSIRLHGFDQPIVIDSQNIIIKGHGRLLAAKKLGCELVPVIKRNDLTLLQAAASRLADNRVAESPWDENLLPLELNMLDEQGIDLAESTGFSEEEIKELIGSLNFDEGSGQASDTKDDNFDSDEQNNFKIIKLFYYIEKEKEFRNIVEKLSEKLKTENISDTVYEAILHCSKNIV